MTYSAEWPTKRGPEGEVYFIPYESIIPTKRDKGFAASGVTNDVRSIEPGSFLLLAEPFAVLSTDSKTVAHFNEIPELSLSRQRSAQEVIFGQLVVSSATTPEAVELVAIKPYNLARGAVQEAGALHVVNNLDPDHNRLLAFEPLGFYRMPDGRQSGLITRYDASVITQDNLLWNPDRPPTDAEVCQAFSQAAVALGGLHYHSLAHHDAQVKNIARDNKGVRIVDLTELRHVGSNEEDARLSVQDDIRKYMASLSHVDDPNGEGVERKYSEALMDVFVPSYISAAKHGINGQNAPHETLLLPAEVQGIVRELAA